MSEFMDRRRLVKLLGGAALIAGTTRAGGRTTEMQGAGDDASLKVYITGTMALVVWDTHVELVMPHHSRLLYMVFTNDVNDADSIGAYEQFKANQTYQLRGTIGSGKIPLFGSDTHVVLNGQSIHRDARRMHCSVLLPFPDRVDKDCKVTKAASDPPFFKNAPNGVNPNSIFLHHTFVYEKYDPAQVGISTVKPVGNELLIWSEPIKQGDTGPFKSNVKLLNGLHLELNNAYADLGCNQTQQMAHVSRHRSWAKVNGGLKGSTSFAVPDGVPVNRLPACMKIVVNNLG
jgi:hypothetical protein